LNPNLLATNFMLELVDKGSLYASGDSIQLSFSVEPVNNFGSAGSIVPRVFCKVSELVPPPCRYDSGSAVSVEAKEESSYYRQNTAEHQLDV
jgi:hypothetical protein